jgi:hypothetical protein
MDRRHRAQDRSVPVDVTLHETAGPDEYRNVLAQVHRAMTTRFVMLADKPA